MARFLKGCQIVYENQNQCPLLFPSLPALREVHGDRRARLECRLRSLHWAVEVHADELGD